jgi:O-antigen/teichoic acid export membrane protein
MARDVKNISWMVPNIMSIRATFSILVIIITTLSAWLFGKSSDMVLGIFIASLGLLLYAFQGPLDSALIAQERLYLSSILNLFNQITFVILGTISLLTGLGYIGLLVSSLIGVLVMGLGSIYVVRKTLKIEFQRPSLSLWKPLLRSSLPFGIMGVVTELTRRFDVVFMSFVLTYSAVGMYNVPYNLITMMLLLAQSLALSIYPSMVKEHSSGTGSLQDTVQRSVRYLLLLSLPMAVGGTLLADRVILVLYGNNFADSISVMRVLVWVLPSMFLAEILGRASYTLQLENKVAKIVFINAAITLSLDLLLIPRWGIIGAACVMVLSRLISIVQTSVVIGPVFLYKGSVRPLLRVVFATFIMGFVIWCLRDASFLAALDAKLILFLLIFIGVGTFGLSALLVQAISPGEARYISDVVYRRIMNKARR